jgi:tRNA A37 threonylcarbamoyladenosine modification protein TsaB
MLRLNLNIRILVISIANPILVGIYDNQKLIETIKKGGKSSDMLPLIFSDILNRFDIKEILYVNGPGSFMAIKVAYIFLKTLSITKNIHLKAIDGFTVNNNSPIKALAKKYFFKGKDDNIYLDFLKEDTKIENFMLPLKLNQDIGSEDSLPNYNLPAVN